MERSMPEEQQKIVLHLCGCCVCVCVCVCLEASKYTELFPFQDYFYIRSVPGEDVGNDFPPKMQQRQTVPVWTSTSSCPKKIWNVDDKSKPSKDRWASAIHQHVVAQTRASPESPHGQNKADGSNLETCLLHILGWCRRKWVTWLPDGGTGACVSQTNSWIQPSVFTPSRTKCLSRGLRRES